ncbi:ArgE/DapE family deacylase [Leucobacter chromiireducens]|uniref:ArgE/DapE family deacylase n=1 Tax=Leucobacter chromiireducens subsp. chromiireducens TaxID=660067 RepID=A0ABS1SP01_9MICO|nr:ArgE/DapE family deacylase [Leucobacter chromiireducens subsp. chromiireducens]
MDLTPTTIRTAVDRLFDREVEFLAELVRHPSLRGAERSAQDFMAAELTERGFEVDRWEVRTEDIAELRGYSPVETPYTDAPNVVGALRSRTRTGRSLIVNGHIDVVPTGPREMWAHDPFAPEVSGTWLSGRGGGDMKAGLASNLFAVEALRELGMRPAADLFYQSVVEEECTGNGALACLQRGYRADAALISEPFSEHLVSAQVGVLWFQVHLRGRPTHVAYAGSGANAIEAAFPLVTALHELEAQRNAPERRHPEFAEQAHALNLNIGKIVGGDWASSVPAWCSFDARMGVFPGEDLGELRAAIEETIRTAAAAHPFLANSLPEITYFGFAAEGYALADDTSPTALAATASLATAHAEVAGAPLEHEAITATTDARFFGVYADTPALVYGPKAESIHGFDERVDLESVRRVTQATALFIADWCGLEEM